MASGGSQDPQEDLPVGQAHSHSWLGAQKNVVRIFDSKFRASSPARQQAYPLAWDAMSEAQICNPKLYEDFVRYIKDEYVIEGGRNNGEKLSVHSVMNYLGCLIQVAANRFKATGSDSSKLFFTCQDPSASTESAQWLRALKTSVQRDLFERAFTSGEQIDKSAPALELSVLEDMNQAYSREVAPTPIPTPIPKMAP